MLPALSLLPILSIIFSQVDGCDVPLPLSFSIQNVTLGGQSTKRGIRAEIGTPPQTICLDTLGDWNNTIIQDDNNTRCGDASPALCSFYRGGLFRPSVSSSWVPSNRTDMEYQYPIIHNRSAASWASDKVLLDGTTTLPDFPMFSVVTGGKSTGIGLGRNSTVLNQLYSAGKIASRTWSLWYGFEGGEKKVQLDGNLVLGGYDQAKITGPNVTHPFTVGTDCSNNLLVEVTDISMNMPNGTIISLMNSTEAPPLQACVNPAKPLIALPNNLWNGFVSVAGGEFMGKTDTYLGQKFKADGVFSGNLTFKLSSGLNVTVYNHQLVRPEVAVDEFGRRFVLNNSTREIFMTNESDNTGPYDFGRPFASSIYLHVNAEEEKFTMWQANPTVEQNLVAVVDRERGFCATPAASSQTAQARNDDAPSVGVVVGAVVGPLAALMASGVIMALLYQRQRARRRREGKPSTVASSGSDTGAGTEDSLKILLDAEGHPLPPLPLQPNNIHELQSDNNVFDQQDTTGHHELQSTDLPTTHQRTHYELSTTR